MLRRGFLAEKRWTMSCFHPDGGRGAAAAGDSTADDVIESLVGEGCVGGLAGDGLSLRSACVGVHVLLHSAGGFLALHDLGGAHEQEVGKL